MLDMGCTYCPGSPLFAYAGIAFLLCRFIQPLLSCVDSYYHCSPVSIHTTTTLLCRFILSLLTCVDSCYHYSCRFILPLLSCVDSYYHYSLVSTHTTTTTTSSTTPSTTTEGIYMYICLIAYTYTCKLMHQKNDPRFVPSTTNIEVFGSVFYPNLILLCIRRKRCRCAE